MAKPKWKMTFKYSDKLSESQTQTLIEEINYLIAKDIADKILIEAKTIVKNKRV